MSQEMAAVGPALPIGLVTGYGASAGRLWTVLSMVPALRPGSSIFLNTLTSTWHASELNV